MADAVDDTSSESNSSLSNAANQARIRKERREAKIRAGGSARLNKITGLGGVQRDFTPLCTSQEYTIPEEKDISHQSYVSITPPFRPEQNASSATNDPAAINDETLRQILLGFNPSKESFPINANPLAPGMNNTPGADDPMMKMFQQMLNGTLGKEMGDLHSSTSSPNQSITSLASTSGYIWRVIHAVFSISLGLFIALSTKFTGTTLERERSILGYDSADSELLTFRSMHFFYLFVMAETMLLSSRFLLVKEQEQHGGLLGMALEFLPAPFQGYLRMLMRYFGIWTTVSRDAMVCVFVVGACAWLKGGMNV